MHLFLVFLPFHGGDYSLRYCTAFKEAYPVDAALERADNSSHMGKMIPLIATVAMLLALASGIMLFQYIKARSLSTAGETLTLLAQEMTDKIDLMVFDRYGDIEALARSLQSLRVEDMAGHLDTLKAAHPIYSAIAVTDATGHIVVATEREEVGEDRGHTKSFETIRKRGGLYIDDVQHGAEGSTAITFSMRLVSPEGNFRGIVTTQVPVQPLTKVLEQTAKAFQTQLLPASIEYQLLSQSGEVLFNSGPASKSIFDARELATPSVLLSASGQSGYVEEQSVTRNAQVLTAYARTRSNDESPGLQWTVLARADRSAVLAPIADLAWQMLLAYSLLLILVGALVALIAHLRREGLKADLRSAWLTGLLRSLGQGVIAVDINGNVSFMNAMAESATGWKESLAHGRRLKEVFALLDGSTRQPLQDPIGRVLHERRAVTLGGPALLIAKDGIEKTIFPVGAPIRHHDGTMLGIALIFREVIPGRQALEEQREEKIESLLDVPDELVPPVA
jgi:PAS domain-containing protein